MLPNFLIIGVQKSATTWLSRNLSVHPEIFIPLNKKGNPLEVNYFYNDTDFQKGQNWLESHFDNVKNEKKIGIKSPGTLRFQKSINRIHDLIPEVKLIIVLRNPIKRAISAVNHFKRIGMINPWLNLDDLFKGILRGEKKYQQIENQFEFINYGKYYSKIKPYYDYFDTSQILILIFEEDVVQSPTSGLKKVYDFLGIYPMKPILIKKKINQNKGVSISRFLTFYFPFNKKIRRYLAVIPPQISIQTKLEQKTISLLENDYYPQNEKLFNLIGRKIDVWNQN